MILNPGDTFMAPKNVPHAYVMLGNESASLLIVFDPAGDIERFFAEYVQALNTDGPPERSRMEAINRENGLRIVGPPLAATAFAD